MWCLETILQLNTAPCSDARDTYARHGIRMLGNTPKSTKTNQTAHDVVPDIVTKMPPTE